MKALPRIALGYLILAGALAFGQNVLNCSSNNGQVQTCYTGRNQNVQFLRQRSEAACVTGRTYGIQPDRVWVSNGCRAEFAVNESGAYNQYPSDQRGVYSNQGVYNGPYSQYPNRGNDNDADDRDRDRDREHHHRHHKYNNGNYNGAYNNGGYGPYNQQRAYSSDTIGVYPGRDYNQSGAMPSYFGRYSNGVSSCSSDQGSGQRYCQTGGPFTQVQMVRQNGRCAQGQTWGVSSYGLWVADGCSAEFTVQR